MTAHLVLYDGECGLCQFSVQWLLKHDRRKLLFFAPLQGESAQPFLTSGELPDGLDSIVYVREGTEFFWYSGAILQLLRLLPAPWSWLSVWRFCPRFISDACYKLVARNRIKIFGKADACRIPTEEEISRFLP